MVLAIATAAIYHVPFTTFVALIDGSSVMIRATIDDGINDFTMLKRDGLSESADVLRRVGL